MTVDAATPASATASSWRSPLVMLMLLAVANQVCFQTWFTLINNFAHGPAHFGGREIGLLQTVREIPGFLSFGVVAVLMIMREQTLAFLALIVLAAGTAITGFFPGEYALYGTTFLFSMGFHYFEPVKQSLALQWLTHETAAQGLGRIISAESFGSIAAFGLVYFTFTLLGWGYAGTYVSAAIITLVLLAAAWVTYPYFPQHIVQNRSFLLRKRYWLYYVLTFFEGARRQIFVVFAGFMMVERFGYSVAGVTALYLVNQLITMTIAPRVGGLVMKFGERSALWLEYAGLALVFTAYAFVTDAWVAAALYMIDNLFFGLSMANSTYFRKIADPADISPTAAVAFSINHIAAVFLPASLGILWVYSPKLVFLTGTACALCSLALACLIPRLPARGRETVWRGN